MNSKVLLSFKIKNKFKVYNQNFLSKMFQKNPLMIKANINIKRKYKINLKLKIKIIMKIILNTISKNKILLI
jgi:hypothetical protein